MVLFSPTTVRNITFVWHLSRIPFRCAKINKMCHFNVKPLIGSLFELRSLKNGGEKRGLNCSVRAFCCSASFLSFCSHGVMSCHLLCIPVP